MSEIYRQLKEYVGLSEKEADEMFSITESDTEYMLTCGWLETSTFKALQQLVEETGGSYTPGTKTTPTTFTIPKKESASAFSIVPINAVSFGAIKTRVKPEFQLQELTDSIRAYGVLEPILVRPIKDGYEVVAGGRRLKAAKTAGLQTVPVIIKELSDIEAFVIQLSENIQRRDLTEEEKAMALAELAEKTGWNATEIANKINMSYQWVVKYLPSEFKDEKMAELGKRGGEAYAESVALQRRAELGKRGGEAYAESVALQRRAKFISTQKAIATELTECEVCGREVHRSRLQIIGGKLTCPQCRGAERPPIKQPEKPKRKVEKPKVESRVYEESWSERKARMRPEESEMERIIQVKLHDDEELRKQGWRVKGPRQICLVHTKPDGFLIRGDKEIPYYLDHEETHKKRRDRDDYLRGLLMKRTGVEPIEVDYKSKSKEEINRVYQQIREEVETVER